MQSIGFQTTGITSNDKTTWFYAFAAIPSCWVEKEENKYNKYYAIQRAAKYKNKKYKKYNLLVFKWLLCLLCLLFSFFSSVRMLILRAKTKNLAP